MTQELHGVISLGGTVIGGSLNQRGLKGETGDKGDTGDAATIAVGTTTTGAAGTNASVTNSGDEHDAVFDFTIPKGDKGDTGDVNTYIAEYGTASYADIGDAITEGKYVIAVKDDNYYPLIMFSNSSYVFSYIHENICHEVVCDSYSTWTARTHTSVRDVKQNGASVTTSGVALVTTPQPTTTTPNMDGTAAVGSETTWAKGDHVHPSDTTKVDKEVGKGLSANDFTDSLKTKLEGVESGAEVNVQSDWNQSTNTADDYIKNKPDLSVYAPLVSPSLTGTPTAPTATEGTNTTQIATTEFVKTGDDAVKEMIKNILPTDTASGAIASFPDGSDLFDYLSCICEINPVQDLHGYDKPWVGGSGTNKWDEQWETGSIYMGTGGDSSTSGYYRSKYFTLQPNTTYYMKSPVEMAFFFYDANKTYLGDQYEAVVKDGTFTTPSGMTYARFRNNVQNAWTPYNNDIAINYPSTVTTYSPWENLCPITGFTGCAVNVSGKNLYGGTYFNYWYLPLPQGTVVRARSDTTTKVEYCRADKTQIDYWTLQSSNGYQKEFTLNEDTTYFRFYFSDSANCQITLANESWDYEPFGQTYPVSWQTEAGTVYGGTVDLVTGVLTVDRAKYDLSQLTWTFDSTRQRWVSAVDNTLKKNTSGNTLTGAICDALEEHTPNEIANNQTIIGFSITANPNITLRNGDTVNSPTGNIVAHLATPTTYQLDPTQIHALLGQNNVWADCGDVEVEYKADVQRWVEKQLIEINTAILALS